MSATWIDRDAVSTARAVRSGEVSAVQIARAFLERIARHDTAVGAFLRVDAEGALAAACTVDARIAASSDPESLARTLPLAGVTVAVKDVLTTRGLRTTCASRILENYVPPYDAHVVARLRDAGAVIVGKTNMDEFAMGSSTENSGFFPTHNPWDLTRAPGGSSGGSAAAVAAGMAHVSLGTDTGGSVRQPASFTGLVGLKPTYGRVSRFGLVAFASSFDVVGPLGLTVADTALLYAAIAGHDPRDATCVPRAVDPIDLTGGVEALRGLRVGVPREYFADGLEPDVASRVRAAIDAVAKAGATVREVSMPHTKYGIPAYYVLAPAEASSNLARFDGVRYGVRRDGGKGTLEDMYGATRDHGFGAEVKRRILLGTFALSEGYYEAFYGKAQKVRTLIREDFTNVFRDVDVLLTPTSPTTAFPLGERVNDPVAMYLADVCTLPPSLAGVPALSLPCGLDARGLPVGLQVVMPPFEESRLFAIAQGIEALVGRLARPSMDGEPGRP
ncbi:MAG: Asp-tRNA(Asn)/Glu-tRNA(Gln) amidotransferase subunit GatA [Deltaproteobacteria bacterium]